MIDKSQATQKGINIIDSTKGVNPLFDALQAQFPETIRDGQVSLKAIATLLGLDSNAGNISGYELTFTGKGLANALYSTPCEKVLKLKETFTPSSQKNNPKNTIIIGDNLDALKILKSAYSEKIKMIYIDPPYNTANDNFIYPDNFRDDFKAILKEVGLIEIDENGEETESEILKFFKNIQSSRTHSGWLAFMLPRLKLARDLLKDDGVIFISIDDNEQANLKILCDEIFGEDNFVACLHIELSTTQGMKVASAQKGQVVKNAEFILVYVRYINNFEFIKPLYTAKEWDDHYSIYIDPQTKKRDTLMNFLKPLYKDISKNKIITLYQNDDNFRDFIHKNAKDIYQDAMIDINFDFTQSDKEKLNNGQMIQYKDYLIFKTSTGVIRQLLPLEKAIGKTDDFEANFGLRKIRGDWWGGFYKDMMNINKEGGVIFKNGKKPMRLIKDLLKISTTPNSNDIILDFFAGSGTTAQAVMELNAEDNGNRQFVLVQIDEEIKEGKVSAYDFCKNELGSEKPVISDITAERVRRASAKIAKENVDLGFWLYSLEKKAQLISDEKGTLNDWLVAIFIIAFVGLIVIKTDLQYLNPLILILGFHLYMANNGEKEVFILSKKPLSSEFDKKFNIITDNLYKV